MWIKEDKTLRTVQQEFSDLFPLLKIEFYDAQHVAGEGSPPFQQLQDYSKTIAEVRKIDRKGDLRIYGQMKVSELEETFYELFGINIQVFRKSGHAWIQTTATDHWTLSEQMEKAKQFLEMRERYY